MKNFRKIISCCIALVMVFSLSLTAFAEGATLTVEGNELNGKTVTAVRMFNATFVDKDTSGNVDGQMDPNEQVGYTLESAWQPFFTGLGYTTSDDAYAYVASLSPDNSNDITAFAKLAKDYYNAHASDFAALRSTSPAASNNTAIISNLATGYYLVMPDAGSTSTTRHHDAILVNVPSSQSNPKVQLKSEYPTVAKTVDGAATAAVQIGDVVTFTLTTTVPDMTEYDVYQFAFKDTMSAGLTFVEDSLTVKVGGTAVKNAAADGYQFTRNGQNITVSFANLNDENTVLTNDDPIVAGNVITLTYQAKINSNAVIDGAGNPNAAYVEYSNDPSDATGATKGTSTTVRATVYSYSIEINKYHDDYDMTQNALPGATFELYRGASASPVQLVLVSANTYRVATAEEIADNTVSKVTSVTTPASGIITINGLDADTYHLKETVAPSGYNKLGTPVDIVITAGTDYSDPQFTIGTNAATDSNIIKVQNNDGSMLPLTGGKGTVIATTVGAIIVVFAVAVLMINKEDTKKKGAKPAEVEVDVKK